MAVNTGYTTGIRSALNEKGITNDRISYNPTKGVMIDGNSFYQPERVYNGTSFTSPTNFANAWNNYNKTYNQTPTTNTTNSLTYGQLQQNQQSQQPQQYNYNPYASSNTINNNPYTSQVDQIIKQLLSYNQNQQPFDPYSSSAYQAAQAQAQKAAQQSTRAAQESFGSAGFGRSTALGERVAGINNDATEYLMTQVLPQIEAQEQARKQQEFNNLIAALEPLRIQQNRADDLVQNDITNRISEGQLTGNYINPEAEAIIDKLLGLKSNTEVNWKTYTPEQRTSATSQADVYRNQLAAMGIDPSLFGSNVSAANATQNKVTVGRTIQGQELDFKRETDNRDFTEDTRRYEQDRADQQEQNRIANEQWELEYGIRLSEVTGYLPDGTPTTKEQQRQLENLWFYADQMGTIPNELADLYGLPRGTQTRAAKEFAANHALNQYQAESGRISANASMMNAQTNRSQENRIASAPRETTAGSNTESTPKVSSKESYDNYNILAGDMQKAGSKERAVQLLQVNADFLTDSDYRKLMDYINDLYQ